MNQIKNVAIGFVTGRKNFKNVLRTYAFRWKDVISQSDLNIHLIVAYDLSYNNTQIEDYIVLQKKVRDVFSSVTFLGPEKIKEYVQMAVGDSILTEEQAEHLFEKGYAGKRNVVLFEAILREMDAIIFLDDDEYPLAVAQINRAIFWQGQDVFREHVKHLEQYDVTNGYHCGYISPIPHVDYDKQLTEEDFRSFIEAVSNDILRWENLQEVMKNGGITYADEKILQQTQAFSLCVGKESELPISGSNLGLRLSNPGSVKPFYNPPNARGEDTFFGLSLTEHLVGRIPVYTFHDGFMQYPNLLNGVLPLRLKTITSDNTKVVERFQRACMGLIRYKPLYLYILSPGDFSEKTADIRTKLKYTTPKLAAYFHSTSFTRLRYEFDKFCKNTVRDYELYLANQENWRQLILHTVDAA